MRAWGKGNECPALGQTTASRNALSWPRLRAQSQGPGRFGLTQCEAHILALMRDGQRNATIAKHLFSVDADHHACAILAKLGV